MSTEVKESDKPFILAIISSGMLVLSILTGSLGAVYNKPDLIEYGKHAIEISMILTTMAWTHYFKGKA